MLKNIEGQKVPTATFPTRQDDQWINITTDELFSGMSSRLFERVRFVWSQRVGLLLWMEREWRSNRLKWKRTKG